jgi:hypothetical protein
LRLRQILHCKTAPGGQNVPLTGFETLSITHRINLRLKPKKNLTVNPSPEERDLSSRLAKTRKQAKPIGFLLK